MNEYCELKDLLEFAPPAELRRSLETIFFNTFMEDDTPVLPNQKGVVSHFYYLINFLNELERGLNGSK